MVYSFMRHILLDTFKTTTDLKIKMTKFSAISFCKVNDGYFPSRVFPDPDENLISIFTC